jgi:hypothetical protein
MIANAIFNMPIATDSQRQKAASRQGVVVWSSSRYGAFEASTCPYKNMAIGMAVC